MKLINPDYEEKPKALKKSKTGLEIEYHLLNKDGTISNQGHNLIKDLKENGDKHVTKEIGKNMVEFGCYPSVATYNPVIDMISSIQTAVEIAQKKDLLFYPFATYPGKFTPKYSENPKYEIQKKIFGKDKMDVACRITGFHHHYTLPKSVFNEKTKSLRLLRKSKLSRSMISAYNFEIAIDPILTLFTQSSPFYQGKHLAKNSRMLVYRGGKKLKFMDGLYADHQQIGGLPPYKQTTMDLLASMRKRWQRWHKEIKKVAPDAKLDELYPNLLDITWNPVKINKHGTLEQRGMDANYMSIVAAITVMLKFCLKKIQSNFIEVLPTDFGIDDAFKLENGILYVPPHTYVRNKFQPASAYKGFANKELYDYAKRFADFAKSVTPKSYAKVIQPVFDMLEQKQSTSDKIITYAKRRHFLQEDNTISNEHAAELAVHYAEKLSKDLEETKKKLVRVRGV